MLGIEAMKLGSRFVAKLYESFSAMLYTPRKWKYPVSVQSLIGFAQCFTGGICIPSGGTFGNFQFPKVYIESFQSLSKVALLSILLVLPLDALAARRVAITPGDQFEATLSSGKLISCLVYEGAVRPGKVTTDDGITYFVFSKAKWKKKKRRLKRRQDSLSPTVYRKKLKRLRRKRRAEKRACEALGPVDPSEAFDPHSETLTIADAHHLFRRAGFGASLEELNFAVANGLTATIDRLFNIETPVELDSEAEELSHYVDEDTGERRLYFYGLREAFLNYLVKSPNQLREKMAYFWHDRFAASGRVVDGDDHFTQDYMNILRNQALGNLRELAKQMTVNGVMLEWLNGNTNVFGGVNENYARELWELFMLGIGHYTEQDISHAARCLTGYRFEWDDVSESQYIVYDESLHDVGQKIIFEGTPWERRGNFGVLDVVDITLDAHPQTAVFLATGLLEFFVHKNQDPQVVAELAEYIRSIDYEIAPVVRRILASKIFFSGQARKNGIKTPLEFSVGFLRAMNFLSPSWLVHSYTSAQGLEILNPPTVKGWDDDNYWLNDQWMLSRINFIHDALDAATWGEVEYDFRQLYPSSNATIDQIINHVALLMDLNLTSDRLQELASYLETVQLEEGGVMSFLPAEADDYFVYQKMTGLIYILAHLSEYQLR